MCVCVNLKSTKMPTWDRDRLLWLPLALRRYIISVYTFIILTVTGLIAIALKIYIKLECIALKPSAYVCKNNTFKVCSLYT